MFAFRQRSINPYFCFFYSIFISEINLLATEISASSLQLLNQSIVQQLIKDGNFLDLTLRLSPAGLIQRTVCKFDRMFDIKKDQSDSGLSTFFAFIACGLILFMISSIYSFFLNKFGTSPVFNILLMLSKKSSKIIWVSRKRKHTFCISTPAKREILWRSPLND